MSCCLSPFAEAPSSHSRILTWAEFADQKPLQDTTPNMAGIGEGGGGAQIARRGGQLGNLDKKKWQLELILF